MTMPNWTDPENDLARELAGQGYSAREISERLPGRTRNAVIGYCYRERIPLAGGNGKKLFLAHLNVLIADGMRCKSRNGGCVSPDRIVILRPDATECGVPGCSNNKIPYARHDTCSLHNAERLNAQRKRKTVELVTPGAGYMG